MTVENDAMADTATPELLPCPFCGAEAEIERRGSQRASMIIACTNCGCRVESGDVVGLTEPKVYRWNRRAHDALKAENAKLRASLAKCATKLRSCIERSGTDPEFADIAVEEFRATLEGR